MRRTVNENPCNALGLCDTIAAWYLKPSFFADSSSIHATRDFKTRFLRTVS